MEGERREEGGSESGGFKVRGREAGEESQQREGQFKAEKIGKGRRIQGGGRESGGESQGEERQGEWGTEKDKYSL